MQISAVVITKNEEKNIGACLQSLAWCDEIIVVDDYSTDATYKIISNLKFLISNKYANPKIKIFKRKLDCDFAEQRNFGLSKAKNEWVLFLDADEIVTPALKKEIFNLPCLRRQEFSTAKQQAPLIYDGFYLNRQDVWNGKILKHGEFSKYGWFGNAKLLRLGRKKAGKWVRPVHELWNIKGEVGILKNPIIHFSHQDLREFINKINYFSDLHATALKKEGKKSSIMKIIVWPVGKFVYNYIFRLGFLDGLEGFVISIYMSMHSFLAWSKAWLT